MGTIPESSITPTRPSATVAASIADTTSVSNKAAVMYSPRSRPSTSSRDTRRRDQMRATAPGLRPRRLDVGVLEVPGQECRHAVRVAYIVGHDNTFERMLRTLQFGPTGSHGGRNAPGIDGHPGHPQGAEPVSSFDPAAVGCERRADVAQLVEHLHGKGPVPRRSMSRLSAIFCSLIGDSLLLLYGQQRTNTAKNYTELLVTLR